MARAWWIDGEFIAWKKSKFYDHFRAAIREIKLSKGIRSERENTSIPREESIHMNSPNIPLFETIFGVSDIHLNIWDSIWSHPFLLMSQLINRCSNSLNSNFKSGTCTCEEICVAYHNNHYKPSSSFNQTEFTNVVFHLDQTSIPEPNVGIYQKYIRK